MHFGASAGRADARRRDAGDAVSSSRSGNAADARPARRQDLNGRYVTINSEAERTSAFRWS